MSGKSTSRYLRRLGPALLIVAAPACGPFRRGPDVESAVLVFTNESLEQANVYAVAPGLGARRLGTVMAGRTEKLVVPSDITTRGDNVNIVARLLASSARPQTGPVSIRPGEEYEVRLSADRRVLVFLPGS